MVITIKIRYRIMGLLILILSIGLPAQQSDMLVDQKVLNTTQASADEIVTSTSDVSLPEAQVIVDMPSSLEVDTVISSEPASEISDVRVEQKEVNKSLDVPVIIEKEEPLVETLKVGVFDAGAKRKAVVALVERGMEYLKKNDASRAFGAFSHSQEFQDGELYIFVYNKEGRCLAHGQEANLIWKDLWDMTSDYGVPITQSIIKEALTPTNDGWVLYRWRNATKISYVRQVRKGDVTYIIGAGYYPHSKSDSVVNLVKAAAALFDTIVQSGEKEDVAFSIMSYPQGRFVLGDLYLYALDTKGNLVAHGQRISAIGTNVWNYKDDTGKLLNQEIIKGLQGPVSDGKWIQYVSKQARKEAYAQKVVDKEGKEYFIACGYYPDATQNKVIDLVRRGAQYFKINGPQKAAEEFTLLSRSAFRYGDLSLYVYETSGLCIANGNDQDLVGRQLFNTKDEEGVYYVQALIKKARDGGGWLDFKIKNTFYAAYVELVRLGDKEYIIGSGIYPTSKQETMELLTHSAASYMRTHDNYEAFQLFTSSNRFIRGELDIFVFDQKGICYAYGLFYGPIWRNLMQLKDDDGREIVKLFINAAKRGTGKVTYRLKGRKRLAYIEPVEKDGILYVVGSDFSY